MEPITIVTLLTAVIPFVTTLAKKAFQTKKLNDTTRQGVNALIPIVLGILSTGLYTYSQTNDWVAALAIGLGSGGAASSIRDIDKNLLGIVGAVLRIFKKGEASAS